METNTSTINLVAFYPKSVYVAAFFMAAALMAAYSLGKTVGELKAKATIKK